MDTESPKEEGSRGTVLSNDEMDEIHGILRLPSDQESSETWAVLSAAPMPNGDPADVMLWGAEGR